jgi:hypothetical protein
MKKRAPLSVLVAVVFIAIISTLWPQTSGAEESQEELAGAAQNPVADMISIPVQSNFNGAVHQPQSVQRMVSHVLTDHHGRLEGSRAGSVDGTPRRWLWKDLQDRQATI